ncbi:pantoate--beta-alanine ligase [Desulfatitalea alkaliphila]|uniref:Pantothenate synthetase n=1 Tax=Desulfatitalea alkaliphila TaxID=2929485 RepID=A0AA41URT1_9BACT|nr:pantoate--beta-alanine ligase [Desulfatitalea alkaliphila]MCJ8502603.1 pantoate--beta-alanine ligase [Desulfatitalea alkaliphila]
MQVVQTIAQLRAILQPCRSEGRSVGFVPTMGYLHDGHMALVQRARRENDVVVVSIFVNPTQFGPNEDLAAYPRDLERDLALLDKGGTDQVFCPSVEELYPPGYMTYVHIEGAVTETLCGRSRPGHFRGVATIVSKLFHLVMPHRAYFGQKDAQQVAVIQQMVRDLDFDLEVVPCATVREADGLALSSRNTYLTTAQRAQAPLIHQALQDARSTIAAGERRAVKVVERIKDRLAAIDDSTIDYVSVVDARTLADLETVTGEALIALAIRVGRTRLIDNIRVQV